MRKGFTLIEALIIITLIGILAAILIPQYKYSVIRAKEAVLKENLFQIRDAINKYCFDKKKYPGSLEELVTFRYLRQVPEDPFLHQQQWNLIREELAEDEAYDPEKELGIVDVKSLFQGSAIDGSKYVDW